jgi:hypothetical protein
MRRLFAGVLFSIGGALLYFWMTLVLVTTATADIIPEPYVESEKNAKCHSEIPCDKYSPDSEDCRMNEEGEFLTCWDSPDSRDTATGCVVYLNYNGSCGLLDPEVLNYCTGKCRSYPKVDCKVRHKKCLNPTKFPQNPAP